jgi:hypothetical protein
VTLALCLCLSASAQKSLYNLKFTLSEKNFVDTIAVEWTDRHLFVPVEIGGKTYRFLFDSGASQTSLYDDTPFLADCETVGFTVSHDAVAHRDTVQKVQLPPMTLGQLTLTGCQATVVHRAVRRNYDGIIGFDIVNKGLAMKIDVQAGHIILTDRHKLMAAEPGFTARYRLDHFTPAVELTHFDTYREYALFDTGFPGFYTMNRESFDRGTEKSSETLGKQIEGRAMGRWALGHGGAEQRSEVVFLALDSLLLGGFAFCDLHALTTQGDSKLGAQLLERGAVVFLPKRKRLCFQPYNGEARLVVGNRQTEKVVVPDKGRPVIGLVWERSEAFAEGLREGDVIEKVNGRAITSMADYYRFGPATGLPVKLGVRDKRGFQKTISITW